MDEKKLSLSLSFPRTRSPHQRLRRRFDFSGSPFSSAQLSSLQFSGVNVLCDWRTPSFTFLLLMNRFSPSSPPHVLLHLPSSLMPLSLSRSSRDSTPASSPGNMCVCVSSFHPLTSAPAVMFCLLLSNQMKSEIERTKG